MCALYWPTLLCVLLGAHALYNLLGTSVRPPAPSEPTWLAACHRSLHLQDPDSWAPLQAFLFPQAEILFKLTLPLTGVSRTPAEETGRAQRGPHEFTS